MISRWTRSVGDIPRADEWCAMRLLCKMEALCIDWLLALGGDTGIKFDSQVAPVSKYN